VFLNRLATLTNYSDIDKKSKKQKQKPSIQNIIMFYNKQILTYGVVIPLKITNVSHKRKQ